MAILRQKAATRPGSSSGRRSEGGASLWTGKESVVQDADTCRGPLP